jgi:hypothetical protein
MAALLGGAFIAFLLATSFTSNVTLSAQPLSKLIDYNVTLPQGELIPSLSYNGTINVAWAIPQSALSGLSGTVNVLVTATSANGSGISFPSTLGTSSESSVTLSCIVENGSCSNDSTLSASIPLFLSVEQNSSDEHNVTVSSEIEQGSTAIPQAASEGEGILNSISEKIFSNNSSSVNSTPLNDTFQLPTQSELEQSVSNPSELLSDNPILTVGALILVVAITGVYLLNSKD